MESRPENDRTPVSNEELFWLAFEPTSNDGLLISIGFTLDDRIKELEEKQKDITIEEDSLAPLNDRLEMFALKDARRHVDYNYGRLTGYQRIGCGSGGPLRHEQVDSFL